MSKLLIKGGRVIDPANKVDRVSDILIEGGGISAIDKDIVLDGNKITIIDATGYIVAPGLVDMHVHLRDPGRTDEETIESGLRAAVKGGFTSIACMPNTDPVIDNAAVVNYIKREANAVGFGNVFPIGAITLGQCGERLSEMGELIGSGAVGFSDDGKCVMNGQLMRRALEYSKMWDKPIITHSEDDFLARGGQMHEGYWSTMLGLKGIPAAAEEAIIARDILLAELTGGKLHIAHLSTKGGLELVRQAKARGISVTCEVTPHHLTLTDENLKEYDTNSKVNPPLRAKADVDALRDGLTDGSIDAIASDHAPHARHEKDLEFDYAPFGMIGLETTLYLILKELVEPGIIDIGTAIEKMSSAPAAILGIDKGTLSIGAVADIVVIDTKAKYKIEPNKFKSKSCNSPFVGRELLGAAQYVICAGKVVRD